MYYFRANIVFVHVYQFIYKGMSYVTLIINILLKVYFQKAHY